MHGIHDLTPTVVLGRHGSFDMQSPKWVDRQTNTNAAGHGAIRSKYSVRAPGAHVSRFRNNSRLSVCLSATSADAAAAAAVAAAAFVISSPASIPDASTYFSEHVMFLLLLGRPHAALLTVKCVRIEI